MGKIDDVIAEQAADEYPEHEKLHEVKNRSQAIGEYLDIGLRKAGLVLAAYRPRLRILTNEEIATLQSITWVGGYAFEYPRKPFEAPPIRMILGTANVSMINHRTSTTRVHVHDPHAAKHHIEEAIENQEVATGEKELVEAHVDIQDLMADWFGIDRRRLEEEKRTMMEKLRTKT